jgi:hypothetical protein
VFLVEKASSLIEGDEILDQVTDGNNAGRVTSERLTSEAVPRGAYGSGAPGMTDSTRTGSRNAGSTHGGSPDADIGDEDPPRDLASGMHPRAVRPGELGAFSGGAALVSGERLVQSLQSALSAASRSEAGLGSLHRSVRDASRALTASRHAQESLTEELRVMYRGLSEVMSEKAAVERYAALLTQERDAALDAAEDARREAKRDREFLIREQDRFIQLLLEEHEGELSQLRRGLGFRSAERQGSSSVEEPGAPATVPGVTPAGVPDLRFLPPSLPPSLRFAAEEASPSGPAAASEDNQTTPRASGAALARLALVNTGSGDPSDERAPTYPPPPAVLDLDSLAAEVDGNSERPPPIRRIGVVEPVLHLKPARVPSQLFDNLVSQAGESDPKRKS